MRLGGNEFELEPSSEHYLDTSRSLSHGKGAHVMKLVTRKSQFSDTDGINNEDKG